MDKGEIYKCGVCGRAFFRGEVETSIPDDDSVKELNGFGDNENDLLNGLIICEECRKLSHYERRQLYLLNSLDARKDTYSKDIHKIKEALEKISNIPHNFIPLFTSGRSFKFKLGKYRGYYGRKTKELFKRLFKTRK